MTQPNTQKPNEPESGERRISDEQLARDIKFVQKYDGSRGALTKSTRKKLGVLLELQSLRSAQADKQAKEAVAQGPFRFVYAPEVADTRIVDDYNSPLDWEDVIDLLNAKQKPVEGLQELERMYHQWYKNASNGERILRSVMFRRILTRMGVVNLD